MIQNYTVKYQNAEKQLHVFEYVVTDGSLWRRDRHHPDGPVLVKICTLDDLIIIRAEQDASAMIDSMQSKPEHN